MKCFDELIVINKRVYVDLDQCSGVCPDRSIKLRLCSDSDDGPADGVRTGRQHQECPRDDQHRGTVQSCWVLLSWTWLFEPCLSLQSNGSVNVHIDMDQPVQSEPRLRLVLAENLLRDVNDVIGRMEVRVQPADVQAAVDLLSSPLIASAFRVGRANPPLRPRRLPPPPPLLLPHLHPPPPLRLPQPSPWTPPPLQQLPHLLLLLPLLSPRDRLHNQDPSETKPDQSEAQIHIYRFKSVFSDLRWLITSNRLSVSCPVTG